MIDNKMVCRFNRNTGFDASDTYRVNLPSIFLIDMNDPPSYLQTVDIILITGVFQSVGGSYSSPVVIQLGIA